MIVQDTFYHALVERLQAASAFNRLNQTPPVAILWTDKEAQWESLLPRLRQTLPVLTLGPYAPENRTGPAIWLRCMVAQMLPDADWPAEVIPVIYLPGVSRQELRAVEDCPVELQPLAELQYRGNFWSQKSTRDWTISAFLQTADGGLEIGVAADDPTKEALPRALSRLADVTVSTLRKEAPLNAPKINGIIYPEPVLALLRWMNAPEEQRKAFSNTDWEAFREICRDRFVFDPDTEGNLTAAARLGGQEGAWEAVWTRFAEAPQRYPNLPDLLRRARPANPDGLLHVPASWPQDNEAEETLLRQRLSELSEMMPGDARKTVRELEVRHGRRREWVWAALGKAPLAAALVSLTALAETTGMPQTGVTPQEVAERYAGGGWKADAAAMETLASNVGGEDFAAIKSAVDTLYRSWLETGAVAFQKAVAAYPLPGAVKQPLTRPKSGQCILFSDGLRYDVGQRLAEALMAEGMAVKDDWQFAALPTVTSSAKPAASPVSALFGPGTDFNVVVQNDGAKVTIDVLRRELLKAGYQILMGNETGKTTGSAWTESGSLDSLGHAEDWKLARRIGEEVRALTEKVKTLFAAGWTEVKIITDHGWLLLPGSLPKADLPDHLTEIRKGRCARLRPGMTTPMQTVAWHWNPEVDVAVAPGISCFMAGKEYEHGGLSPQECVVPVLTVRASAPAGPPIAIGDIRWRSQRCNIEISGSASGLSADLRGKAADAATSVASSVKTFNDAGQVSLVVEDEDRKGQAVVAVILEDGRVIAQKLTTIGGD